MIYTKASNFSLPVLNNLQNDYGSDRNFLIKISTKYMYGDNYQFDIELDIQSEFLKGLLEDAKAKLYFIVKSVDSRYYEFDYRKPVVQIPESRIFLKADTQFQVFMVANGDISFANNLDPHPFYERFRDQIVVAKGSLLAISNEYKFSGNITKTTQLFEKSIDPDMEQAIDIVLGEGTIIIKYKDENYQFSDHGQSRNLNNLYIYLGLQKALIRLIDNNLEGQDDDIYNMSLEDGIIVENINSISDLDNKLKNLLLDKGINDLNLSNLDYAVYQIAQGIIDKYTDTVRSLYE